MEFLEALKAHVAQYPLIQPADVVKFAYQSEFGGEYINDSAVSSLARLKQEMKTIVCDQSVSLLEPLGDGFVRVNLAALPANQVSIHTLDSLYLLSSKLYKGSNEGLLKKLDEIKQLQRDTNVFSFSAKELDSFIDSYVADGCLMIPHSKNFKDAYRPAYRVVHEELLNLYLFVS